MSEERIVFMENFRDTANVTEAPTRRFDAHEQVNLVDHSSCMDAGEDGIIIGKVHPNMSFFLRCQSDFDVQHSSSYQHSQIREHVTIDSSKSK